MLIIIYIFTIFLVLYYSINITTFDKNHVKALCFSSRKFISAPF